MIKSVEFRKLVKSNICFFLLCFLLSCAYGKKENGLSFSQNIKFRQYMVQGEKLYIIHCSNCHQVDGSGLGRLIPPLTSNKYIRSNNEQLACILKYGMSGKIEINGIFYEETMPANLSLTNLEMAEIITYIGNNWDNRIGTLNTDNIAKSIINCPSAE